ncbi:MAG: ATPase [Clostridiales bacterium]|nr:ATPase [Clostridiales bacterium]
MSKQRIAILSGKGGTGKTLVSVNLASVAEHAMYIDCDVEEPNGHLFFKPEHILEKTVTVRVPRVNPALCDGCRVCVDFCAFNALALAKNSLLIFDGICHSCGGCVLFCPQNALHEEDRPIGCVREGSSGAVAVKSGFLNPGEASGIPIIQELLAVPASDHHEQIFIDCPPGSSCMAMESITDADFCLLVVEPTRFGVHDLSMVYELVRLFKKPFAAVLNKCTEGTNPAERFCREHNIPIFARIPHDPVLGLMHSNALIAANEDDKYHDIFSDLLHQLTKEISHAAVSHS